MPRDTSHDAGTSTDGAGPDVSLVEHAVGVVGLGLIGRSVVRNIAGAGLRPSVFDTCADRTSELLEMCDVLQRPVDVAAASDVVFVAVDDAEQARQVLAGDEGLLAAGRDSLVIVLLTTLAISVVKELAETCSTSGVALLDAGVTEAGDEKFVTMVGGPLEAVERLRPLLGTFSKNVIHCGGPGTGMVTKIARNVVTYASWAVVREAAAVAEAGGVTPGVLLEVMKTATADGTAQLARLEDQVAGHQPTDAAVAMLDAFAQNDLAAAQEFTAEAGVMTPIVDVVRPTMARTFEGEFHDTLPEDPWERGIAMATKVYGAQTAGRMNRGPKTPSMIDTVEHLFAEIWARGNLTIRDRRLMVLGATTMLGRGDLLEIQLRGALQNGEFTKAQVHEMALFLTYYTSIENGGTFSQAAGKILAEFGL